MERVAVLRRVSSLSSTSREVSGVWIIESDATAEEIRDSLSRSIRGETPLLVFSAGYEAAWAGISKTDAEWLIQSL
jgi:hypothetical protein